jgi:hypothetical protein
MVVSSVATKLMLQMGMKAGRGLGANLQVRCIFSGVV